MKTHRYSWCFPTKPAEADGREAQQKQFSLQIGVSVNCITVTNASLISRVHIRVYLTAAVFEMSSVEMKQKKKFIDPLSKGRRGEICSYALSL